MARQLFYDRLLADFAGNPRTILLSSHLIDEVANLLDHVIVIDEGKIIIDAEADALRGAAATVIGPAGKVEAFLAGRKILHRETMALFASVTVDESLTPVERAQAAKLGLEVAPVSLQQLIVRRTIGNHANPNSQEGGTAVDALEATR